MAPVITLDPAYAAYSENLKNLPKFWEEKFPLSQLREAANQRVKAYTNLPEVLEEDRTINYNGTDVRLTLFRPPGTENETLPVVIFYHGGGWVFCSKHTHIKPVRDICVINRVAVVFPDYSLAPEHKYPTAHNEAFAALCWIVENGDSIKVDARRLAVCGDSAGGNLSTVISLMAKERGLADTIKTQILIYPATAYSREGLESPKLFGNGEYYITMNDCKYFENAYWEGCERTKFCFPSMATKEELSGLPPALVITAEADILRDEGEQYGRQLTDAGVATTTVRMLGTVHGYLTVPVSTPAYKQTMAMITSQLNEYCNFA